MYVELSWGMAKSGRRKELRDDIRDGMLWLTTLFAIEVDAPLIQTFCCLTTFGIIAFHWSCLQIHREFADQYLSLPF